MKPLAEFCQTWTFTIVIAWAAEDDSETRDCVFGQCQQDLCLLNEDECFAISSARWSMKSCFLILRVCSIAPLKMQESCLFLFNFTYQSSICQHNISLLLASICFTHTSSFLPPFLSIPASTCLPLLVINASFLSSSILVKRQLESTTDGWIYALSGRAKILKLCLPLC